MYKKKSLIISMLFIIILSTLNISVLSISAEEKSRPTIDIKRTYDAPIIDGSIDEEMWNVNEPLTNHIGSGKVPEAKFGVLWDQEYVYVAVDVVDEILIHDGTGYWYEQDNIGLFFDPTLHQSAPFVGNDLQIGLVYNPDSTEPDLYFGGASVKNHDYGNESKIKKALNTTDKGWSVEVAVPWEMLGFDPNTSKELGLEVHAVDRNTEDENDSSVSAWSAFERTSFWNDTYGFGKAVLVTDILSENFDGLESSLQPAKDEDIDPSILGWTHESPEGWEVKTDPNMPQGVSEWQGWSFATKEFWVSADTQLREEFSKGSGVIAIADPDEWDDIGNPASKGNFDSTLVAPEVDVNGGDTLDLSFDTHYRQEGIQTALVTAIFDTGEEETVLRYDHRAKSDNKGIDVLDTTEMRKISVPKNATSMTLKFRLFNAVNNYFWAIDNVRLMEKASLPELTLVGDDSIVIDLGSEYVDPGVTAHDEIDGDITNKVVVEHNIDTSNPGIYKVTYSVTNSTGFTETETREVKVMGVNGNDGLNMSFSVISDFQTNDNKKISRALWDLNLINPNQHAMVVLGDIVSTSDLYSYGQVKKVMDNTPHPDNLFYTVGNHEYYGNVDSETAKQRFLDFAGLEDKVYYEEEVNGYPFIVLGMENSKEPVDLSDAQLDWFEKTMEKTDPNEPAFVFLHQPLPYTINGTWDMPYYRYGIVQYERLKEILSKYPNAIYFSGHQHWDLRSPDMFTNKDGFYQVSSGAIVNMYGPDGNGGEKVIDGTASTGLYVQVYEDKVVINGRDFRDSEWIEEYKHAIPIKSSSVDKSALETAVTEAEEMQTAGYTEESVENYLEKLALAQEVLESKEATEAEVDAALASLQQAIASLTVKEESVDKSALEIAVTEAEEMDTAVYTEESVENYLEKLVLAQEVLANEEATEAEVATALASLQEAIASLTVKEESVDKSALEIAVTEAEEMDTADYTEESVENYLEKLALAQEVLANEEATEAEVATALASLQEAIASLTVPEESVDKLALEVAIEKAEKMELTVYTEESVENYLEKLALAKTVLANEKATEAEVATALASLQEAIASLEVQEVPVDKSALEEKIQKSEDIRTENYTKETVKDFKEKLAEAKEVATNDAASQSEVDEALEALQNTINNLIIVVNDDGKDKDKDKNKGKDKNKDKDKNKGKDKDKNKNKNKDKDKNKGKDKDHQVITDKKKDGPKGGSETTSSKNEAVANGNGETLPNTATSVYTIILIGLLIVSLGVFTMYMTNKRRKIKE